MIRRLFFKDANIIWGIINKAAYAYKGVIPNDRYYEPYMPKEELLREMKSITFFGWHEERKLIGVMGFQTVGDVTLIRHAYVLPDYQQKGIGMKLLNHMKKLTKTKYLLVGTWADASWAIKFYQKHGFQFMPNKDELLREYWNIPERQIDASVVLCAEV
ncbi:GNAT family N-acetyltransferase [Chloroflexota bacterium]